MLEQAYAALMASTELPTGQSMLRFDMTEFCIPRQSGNEDAFLQLSVYFLLNTVYTRRAEVKGSTALRTALITLKWIHREQYRGRMAC